MTPFRVAQIRAQDWRSASRSCAEQLADLPAAANIGFVYVSDPLSEALDLIVAALQRATGIATWIGTGGSGVCATGREYVGEGGLVAMVGVLPPDSFRTLEGYDGTGALAAGTAWRRAGEAGVAVVHGDPRQPRLPEMIAALADDGDLFLVGGLSSSAASGVQMAGRPVEGGLSGLLLGAGVTPISGLTQGCVPIGPVHEVTGARSRWVTSLDGRPALEVLKQEVGEILSRQLDRISHYIHIALPVPGSDRPDYLVRNLAGIDLSHGAIATTALMRRGDRLLFVKRDAVSARQDLYRMLEDLRRRAAGRPPRAALYHACIARGPNMFGPDSAELRMIQDVLGPVPLIGLFANGEIFHSRLYAYTGVLTLLL